MPFWARLVWCKAICLFCVVVGCEDITDTCAACLLMSSIYCAKIELARK